MVATAGSIAKLPTKNVARMPHEPQMSSMMLRVLRRNHSENTLMAPIRRSSASTKNHATDLGAFPALVAEGCSSSHGKHRPAEMVSHITEETTPALPLAPTLDTENSWLDSRLLATLVPGDGPTDLCLAMTTKL